MSQWWLSIPRGARLMVVSALWLSLMGLFVKLAGQRLPTHELVFARSLVTFVLSFYAVRRAGVSIVGQHKGLLAARGACGFLAMLCVYYSVTRLPLAEATVIQFCHPVFTALLAARVLGERTSKALWLAIGLSLLGVLLIARPPWLFGVRDVELDAFALWVAFVGAALSAGSYVLVRRLSQTEHPHVIIFYFPLIALPASVPLLALDAVWPVGIEWLWLLALGVATQLGQLFLTRGLREESAGRAGAFSYAQVVFAALWGVLCFDEVPRLITGLGALLIFAGGLVVARSPQSALQEVASPAKAR